MSIPWAEVETVLLDMDGTLLDLHFDNYFWLEYLPRSYAITNNLSIEQAKEKIFSLFSEQQGTLQWYCIDYWTEVLGLPILQLKKEISHLIKWREGARLFLQQLNQMGKRTILITNAHRDSLVLKMQKVDLAPWFQNIISSHDYGAPKENLVFWQILQRRINLNTENSLFIDDSVRVLQAAKDFGIKFLYAIDQPDSKGLPLNHQHHFKVIKDYKNCLIKV